MINVASYSSTKILKSGMTMVDEDNNLVCLNMDSNDKVNNLLVACTNEDNTLNDLYKVYISSNT